MEEGVRPGLCQMHQVEPDISHRRSNFHRMEENDVIDPVTEDKKKRVNKEQMEPHFPGRNQSSLLQHGNPDTDFFMANPTTANTSYTHKKENTTITCFIT